MYAQHLFLTYPRCSLELKEAFEQLQKKFKGREWLVVARELHEDGTPHLHAALRLKKRRQFKVSSFADLSDGTSSFHGNYQAARSIREVVAYVIKDGEFLAEGVDPVEFANLTPKETKFGRLVKVLADGGTMAEAHAEDKVTFAREMKKLTEYRQWLINTGKRQREEVPPVTSIESSLEPPLSIPLRKIVKWLTNNLIRLRTRPIRASQLWIYGAPGVGKTTFAMLISKCWRVYFAPEENWWGDFDEDEFDLMIFDEYIGQFPRQFMNKLLDGQELKMPVKLGSQPVLKKRNIPIIVLSNVQPMDLYQEKPNPVLTQAFASRFLVCRVDDDELPSLLLHSSVAEAQTEVGLGEG